jgi:hypothetical protein
MKNIINDKRIENILNSFKPNESVSLSLNEKQNILKSVFERVQIKEIKNTQTESVRSPFYTYQTYLTQYLKYSIPVLLIAVIGTQAVGVFTNRSKIALSDINEVKQNLDSIKRDNSIKSNLSKNQQDIQEIKIQLASSGSVNNNLKTQILADKITTRSREIRNQVAALVDENKLTEAKKVALDLESALKADELYKVSTSVQAEVFSAIDLRVDIERKEKNNISTSTESDTKTKIEDAKKEIVSFEKNASTTDIILEAEKSIATSEEHLKAGDIQNAVIALQSYDRIVADLRVILLP